MCVCHRRPAQCVNACFSLTPSDAATSVARSARLARHNDMRSAQCRFARAVQCVVTNCVAQIDRGDCVAFRGSRWTDVNTWVNTAVHCCVHTLVSRSQKCSGRLPRPTIVFMHALLLLSSTGCRRQEGLRPLAWRRLCYLYGL